MPLKWEGDKAKKTFAKTARGMVMQSALLYKKNVKAMLNQKGGRTESGLLETIRTNSASGKPGFKRREPGSGKRAQRIGSFASQPGEPPRRQTGRLIGSIEHEMIGLEPKARVGTNLEYARALEFGFLPNRLKPRPYMRPALQQSEGAIRKIFGRKIKGRRF